MRRYSPLYYRGLSMLNWLWVYKFFMILKYCNRWHPPLIQENKLNSPAGNRTLVSRVTGGDTHHYTTEDSVMLKYRLNSPEFINSWWFWSNVIDYVLYEYRKISWTPRQGNEPWSPAFIKSRDRRGYSQGIEPWSPAWQAGIPTILPRISRISDRLCVFKILMILK